MWVMERARRSFWVVFGCEYIVGEEYVGDLLADAKRSKCVQRAMASIELLYTPRTWDQALPFRFRKGSWAALEGALNIDFSAARVYEYFFIRIIVYYSIFYSTSSMVSSERYGLIAQLVRAWC